MMATRTDALDPAVSYQRGRLAAARVRECLGVLRGIAASVGMYVGHKVTCEQVLVLGGGYVLGITPGARTFHVRHGGNHSVSWAFDDAPVEAQLMVMDRLDEFAAQCGVELPVGWR